MWYKLKKCQYHMSNFSKLEVKSMPRRQHTSCNLVNFMLDKKVNQRHNCSKEGTPKDFPVFDSCWVGRAKRQAS